MKSDLITRDEAATRIRAGKILLLAGAEEVLTGLPAGTWIGGTAVYFLTEEGGREDRTHIFCTELHEARDCRVRHLPPERLPELTEGRLPNGITAILIPAFSRAHSIFAMDAPGYPGIFAQPLIGWIAGSPLEENAPPARVFDGSTGTAHADGAVCLHVALPDGMPATLDIINLFEQGDGASFVFEKSGFSASEALVDGRRVDLARHFTEHGIDTRLPLVANYAGAMINVSVRSVSTETGRVTFFAPVVAGVEYRLARSPGNYVDALAAHAAADAAGDLSCNCILNYLYGELEGRCTGTFTGPATFGEIAYMLLNQTLVHLHLGKDPPG